jgi:hypothetical protein
LLLASDSPRASGEDVEHVRALAETTTPLPPIIVHRPTMRVIDGMHRLEAARLRGETRIRVRFGDGDEDDAFVLAVRSNVTHGLPLTRADRIKAAERIVRTHAHWSDRAIAEVAGLSHHTIGAIRRRSTGQSSQPNTRVGRDGRSRPTDREARRARAIQLVSDNPDAPLRQISHAAGISVSTAKQVRDHVRAQAAAEAGGVVDDHDTRAATAPRRPVGRAGHEVAHLAENVAWVVNALKRDPSVRQTNAGRALLRLLSVHSIEAEEWRYLTEGVPAHCRDAVAHAARSCAESWSRFARQLGDDGR